MNGLSSYSHSTALLAPHICQSFKRKRMANIWLGLRVNDEKKRSERVGKFNNMKKKSKKY